MKTIYVGTAAWTLPKDYRNYFPAEGTHLEKYSRVFNAVEINSSFYREHKSASYRRWRECTPQEFRFSVKLSKVLTHQQRLKKGELSLKQVLSLILELEEKLGCLLIQLPPSLDFDKSTAESFFQELRDIYEGPAVLEPRHLTWTSPTARHLLEKMRLSEVIADPDPLTAARQGQPQLHQADVVYWRLHGSPEIYKSLYEPERMQASVRDIQKQAESRPVWCIFDNTTYGYATRNALEMTESLKLRLEGTFEITSLAEGPSLFPPSQNETGRKDGDEIGSLSKL